MSRHCAIDGATKIAVIDAVDSGTRSTLLSLLAYLREYTLYNFERSMSCNYVSQFLYMYYIIDLVNTNTC